MGRVGWMLEGGGQWRRGDEVGGGGGRAGARRGAKRRHIGVGAARIDGRDGGASIRRARAAQEPLGSALTWICFCAAALAAACTLTRTGRRAESTAPEGARAGARPAPKKDAARTAGAGAAAPARAPAKEVGAVRRCALAIVIAAIGGRGGLSWSEREGQCD